MYSSKKNSLVQMFSGWRKVCGGPGQGGGGKYSHCRKEGEGVARGGHRDAEFSRVTAAGKRLFLSLLVRERRTLYRLPEGRRANSLWLGWELSFSMLRALRRPLLRSTTSIEGSGE